MAYGAFSQNVIQIGREATAGTAVAATEKWRGGFSMVSDSQTRETVEEQVGLRVSPARTYTAWRGGELTVPATAATYEQLPHIFEAGVVETTPAGAGPYTYDWAYDLNTPQPVKTYTVEAGNVTVAGDNREMPFSFVSSWTLSGTVRQPWNMECTWMGQQLAPSTLTPALPLIDVEEMFFNNTELYIDATGGTVGGTQITEAVLMAAEINATSTGVIEVPAATGNNYYTAIKYVEPTITFSLTFELENTANIVANARTAYEAGTPQLIQLLIPGTGGRSARFRFAGEYDDFGDYSNDNGNTTVQVGGNITYNSTDNLYFEAQIINNRATL